MFKSITSLLLLISFLFPLSSKSQDTLSETKRFQVNGLLGVKIFNPWADISGNYFIYHGSLYFPSIIGLEIHDSKSHLSVDLRQNYFTSISAADPLFPSFVIFRKTTLAGFTYYTRKKIINKIDSMCPRGVYGRFREQKLQRLRRTETPDQFSYPD